MESVQTLRKRALQERDLIDGKERARKSLLIVENFLSCTAFQAYNNFFIYVNFRSEVETVGLIEKLLISYKNVFIPLTLPEEKQIKPIRIKNIVDDVQPGYCGIQEPRTALMSEENRRDDAVEVIILPGALFDRRGGRIGYGGGYYDRYLEKNKTSLRVGLAYSSQITEKLPLTDYDQLLDYVITENQILEVKRSLAE